MLKTAAAKNPAPNTTALATQAITAIRSILDNNSYRDVLLPISIEWDYAPTKEEQEAYRKSLELAEQKLNTFVRARKHDNKTQSLSEAIKALEVVIQPMQERVEKHRAKIEGIFDAQPSQFRVDPIIDTGLARIIVASQRTSREDELNIALCEELTAVKDTLRLMQHIVEDDIVGQEPFRNKILSFIQKPETKTHLGGFTCLNKTYLDYVTGELTAGNGSMRGIRKQTENKLKEAGSRSAAAQDLRQILTLLGDRGQDTHDR